MKSFLLIIIILLQIACDSHLKKRAINAVENSDLCFVYPPVIDSLKLTSLYDTARWYIYTWHCDLPYLPKTHTSKAGSFGELELRFNHLIFKHDTVEIDFDFVDKGQSILTGSTRNARELATGVWFDFASKKKLAMYSHNGYSFQAGGEKSRYENPIQPEVTKYIKENWGKINRCFKELALQKGIKKDND